MFTSMTTSRLLLAQMARKSVATSNSFGSVNAGTRWFHATAQAEAKLNVEGLAERVNLKGQNVLVRVDLNVPLDKAGTSTTIFWWNFMMVLV